jgi:hypothetical protein
MSDREPTPAPPAPTADVPVSTVTITLRPEPGNWSSPPVARLKRLLKAIKRGYGWTCVNIHTKQPNPNERNEP